MPRGCARAPATADATIVMLTGGHRRPRGARRRARRAPTSSSRSRSRRWTCCGWSTGSASARGARGLGSTRAAHGVPAARRAAGLDAGLVVRVVAPLRPVVGDRGPRSASSRPATRSAASSSTAQLAARRAATRSRAGEAVPRAREGEQARAPAVAVRGEHRADAAVGRRCRRRRRSGSRGRPRASPAACARQAVDGPPQPVIGSRAIRARHGRRRRAKRLLLLKGSLHHEARRPHRLLGPRPVRRPTSSRSSRRPSGSATTPSGPRRPTAPTPRRCSRWLAAGHVDDPARLGDLPDARPLAGDDRDDRRDARPPLAAGG